MDPSHLSLDPSHLPLDPSQSTSPLPPSTKGELKVVQLAQEHLGQPESWADSQKGHSFILIEKEPEPDLLEDFVLVGLEANEQAPSAAEPPSTSEVKAISSSSSPSATSSGDTSPQSSTSSSIWSLSSSVVGLAKQLNLMGSPSTSVATTTPSASLTKKSTAPLAETTTPAAPPKEGSTAGCVEAEMKKGALASLNRAVRSGSSARLQQALASLPVDHCAKAFYSENIERYSTKITITCQGSKFNLRNKLLPQKDCQEALSNGTEANSKAGKFVGEIEKKDGVYFCKKPVLENKDSLSILDNIKKELNDKLCIYNDKINLTKDELLELESKFKESYKKYNIASFNALFSDLEGLKSMHDEEKHAFMSLCSVSDCMNFADQIKQMLAPTDDWGNYVVRQYPGKKVVIEVSQGEEGWILSKTFLIQLWDSENPENECIPKEGVPITIRYNLTHPDEIPQFGFNEAPPMEARPPPLPQDDLTTAG